MIRESRDVVEIERFLRRNAAAHAYALADLDEPFWSRARWTVSDTSGELDGVAMLLDALAPPVLYAVAPESDSPTRALLDHLADSLPERVFVSLGLGLVDALLDRYAFESHGVFLKMRFTRKDATRDDRFRPTPVRLASSDLSELVDFFAELTRLTGDDDGRFSEPFMLEQGPYYGIRQGRRLVAAGGTHVLSRERSVCAIGNVATHPDHRRRGMARAITSALCRDLAAEAELVTLNVQEANEPAVACYRSLGFETVCRYEEGILELRT